MNISHFNFYEYVISIPAATHWRTQTGDAHARDHVTGFSASIFIFLPTLKLQTIVQTHPPPHWPLHVDDADLLAPPMASTTMALCALFTGPHLFPSIPPLHTVWCGQTHKGFLSGLLLSAPIFCIHLWSVGEPLSAVKSDKSPGRFSASTCSWIH